MSRPRFHVATYNGSTVAWDDEDCARAYAKGGFRAVRRFRLRVQWVGFTQAEREALRLAFPDDCPRPFNPESSPSA